MVKTLYCTECGCKVAEITSGSKLMVGMKVLCASCGDKSANKYVVPPLRKSRSYGELSGFFDRLLGGSVH